MGTEPWKWMETITFCLTFTRGRTPREVVDAYGADVNSIRLITREEIAEVFDPRYNDIVVSVGKLEAWTFCIEFVARPIGNLPQVMSNLSEGTDTAAVVLDHGWS